VTRGEQVEHVDRQLRQRQGRGAVTNVANPLDAPQARARQSVQPGEAARVGGPQQLRLGDGAARRGAALEQLRRRGSDPLRRVALPVRDRDALLGGLGGLGGGLGFGGGRLVRSGIERESGHDREQMQTPWGEQARAVQVLHRLNDAVAGRERDRLARRGDRPGLAGVRPRPGVGLVGFFVELAGHPGGCVFGQARRELGIDAGAAHRI